MTAPTLREAVERLLDKYEAKSNRPTFDEFDQLVCNTYGSRASDLRGILAAHPAPDAETEREWSAQYRRHGVWTPCGVGWTPERSTAEEDVAAWSRDGYRTRLMERVVGPAQVAPPSVPDVATDCLVGGCRHGDSSSAKCECEGDAPVYPPSVPAGSDTAATSIRRGIEQADEAVEDDALLGSDTADEPWRCSHNFAFGEHYCDEQLHYRWKLIGAEQAAHRDAPVPSPAPADERKGGSDTASDPQAVDLLGALSRSIDQAREARRSDAASADERAEPVPIFCRQCGSLAHEVKDHPTSEREALAEARSRVQGATRIADEWARRNEDARELAALLDGLDGVLRDLEAAFAALRARVAEEITEAVEQLLPLRDWIRRTDVLTITRLVTEGA